MYELQTSHKVGLKKKQTILNCLKRISVLNKKSTSFLAETSKFVFYWFWPSVFHLRRLNSGNVLDRIFRFVGAGNGKRPGSSGWAKIRYICVFPRFKSTFEKFEHQKQKARAQYSDSKEDLPPKRFYDLPPPPQPLSKCFFLNQNFVFLFQLQTKYFFSITKMVTQLHLKANHLKLRFTDS